MADIASSLGGIIDGVFRQHAVFNEQGLVAVPHHLSYEEAASLPCAAVTAWNALYHGSKPLRVGDTVVTQGTGGVSVFATLFALKAGARVIGTTSSAGKAERLKKMGVQHVIITRKIRNGGWLSSNSLPAVARSMWLRSGAREP